jgi:hypothetical protein
MQEPKTYQKKEFDIQAYSDRVETGSCFIVKNGFKLDRSNDLDLDTPASAKRSRFSTGTTE